VNGFPFARRADLAPRQPEADVTQPPAADGVPGRQHLTGYRLRDCDDLIATLRSSWLSQGLTLVQIAQRMGRSAPQPVSAYLSGKQGLNLTTACRLVQALGYDLALIPREEAPPLGVHSNGARRCSQPGHGTLGCACPRNPQSPGGVDA